MGMWPIRQMTSSNEYEKNGEALVFGSWFPFARSKLLQVVCVRRPIQLYCTSMDVPGQLKTMNTATTRVPTVLQCLKR